MTTMMVVVLVCVTGCTAPIGDHYTVVVDPKLSPKYTVAVFEAYANWVEMLDGKLSIDYSTTHVCQGVSSEICIHASSHAWIVANGGSKGSVGFTEHHWWGDRSDVYLPIVEDENATPATLLTIVTHELGHSVGLLHTQANTIMCFGIECASPTITCDDADQYNVVHRTLGELDVWPGSKTCPNGGSFTLSGQ